MATDTRLIEENKALIRRVFEKIWNQRDFSVMDEVYAPDIVHHDPFNSADVRGVEELKHGMNMATETFPDLRFKLHELVAEDDTVVAYWTLSGTHENEFAGIPATDEPVEVKGFILSRVMDGQIVEEWALRDTHGMLEQLGVAPTQ